MIEVQFATEATNGKDSRFCYRIAGQDLIADLDLADLMAFKKPCPELFVDRTPSYAKTSAVTSKLLYQGPGWIGNQWREVVCSAFDAGYEISVAGIGDFHVTKNGAKITYLGKGVDNDFGLIVEAMLGPALIMALAKRRTWCLHASAVQVDDSILLFVGESGKGKSTLARWLDSTGEGTWWRLGDDIMPVTMGDSGVDILPHFPQLKIPAGEQPAAGLPERMPLAGLYVIDRPESEDKVAIHTLGAHEAALALVRHTVAARLFDADLLTKQLDFCVQAAKLIPVGRLNYPLIADSLPIVREALLHDIQRSEDYPTNFVRQNS